MAEEQKNNGREVAKKEKSMSERFMQKVIIEFGSSVGEVALTNFQKRLAQNYFIAIDWALRAAEEKRKRKDEKYRDHLPATWANVNMEKLARDVVAAARIGLDPAQPNHINVIPYKNNSLNKYDIVFIEGYRGIELKALKYGLDIPDRVDVELVCSNDTFRPIKKDKNNPVETYEFTINNPFDRGEIIGGFYYHGYSKNPGKNKLVVFTLKDIEKRKPPYASPEFWGGEKTVWKNGKPAGKEQVEGWYEKMCYKTIYRAAYRDITIDSQKIDDDYLRLKQMEDSYAERDIEREVQENANSEVIDVEYNISQEEAVQEEQHAQENEDFEEVPEEEPETEPEPARSGAAHDGQQTIGGPGF